MYLLPYASANDPDCAGGTDLHLSREALEDPEEVGISPAAREARFIRGRHTTGCAHAHHHQLTQLRKCIYTYAKQSNLEVWVNC